MAILFLVCSAMTLPSRLLLPVADLANAFGNHDSASLRHHAYEAVEDNVDVHPVEVGSIQGMAVHEEGTCSRLPEEEDLAGVYPAVGSILEEVVSEDNAGAADACWGVAHTAEAGGEQLLDYKDQPASFQAAVLVGSASFRHSASFEPAARQLQQVSIKSDG
jgi:hypothetical protein